MVKTPLGVNDIRISLYLFQQRLSARDQLSAIERLKTRS